MLPPLESLGPRIIVCGPSNSGKSTLARAIGMKLDLPATHLDLLYHLPHTDWEPRAMDEFLGLHDAAIAGESWVIDGNYSATLPERLARASGIVLLGSEPWLAAARNVRRTLFETKHRAGQLEGGIDKLNWEFFRFILFEQPKKQERYRTILSGSGLPMIELKSMRELKALYATWGLER